MAETLVREVRRLLDALEETQGQLDGILSQKRDSLTGLDRTRLLALADQEAALARRMQGHADRRQQLLEIAGKCGFRGGTIEELVRQVGGPHRDTLLAQIERSREISARLRHESWVHWIIAHRCHSHFTQLLDVVAHCGEPSPTYAERPSRETTGGAVLDASI